MNSILSLLQDKIFLSKNLFRSEKEQANWQRADLDQRDLNEISGLSKQNLCNIKRINHRCRREWQVSRL